MIKFAEININYKKSYFSRIIHFDNDDNLKDDIEYEIKDLISSISKLKHIPRYFIKKLLYAKRYSINVTIYTIINANDLSEDLCKEKLEKFKSEQFCNNENLASFILENYSNKSFSKRLLGFGNLEYYWSFRREVFDYNYKDKFYRIGDIVLIKGYKDPFIITWLNNNINDYNFCNIYDVFCIKNNKIQFTCDDGVHYKDIIKVIDHDLNLAKITIINNRSEYTQEYIDEIINMKE